MHQILTRYFVVVTSTTCIVLYNFDRFVGHASQGVPDVPKYGRCHGVTKGPDERSENVTNLIVAILG